MPTHIWTGTALMTVLMTGCSPVAPTVPPPSPATSVHFSTSAPSPLATTAVPGTDATPSASATPSLPIAFTPASGLLDGGAAVVVARLHAVSGLRPALKLDVTKDEVTLTVLTRDLGAQSYRWRDGVIDLAETDVQYLRQTTFWPTDLALDNVRRIFDVAALHGTSGNGPVLQVVEYVPGSVYMSVSTSPETTTVFFRKDGTIIRSLDTTSVADIREGIQDVVKGAAEVYVVGFAPGRGYYAEAPLPSGNTDRRTRMANRPVFSSQRAGASPLTPFQPSMLDATVLARVIAAHSDTDGCAVEVDNRFERSRPVVTYDCDGVMHYSDLQGTDLTPQLG